MRASPDCSSSSSSSSKLAGLSPSARPASGAPGATRGSRAAPSWTGSPAAMDSDDEMVEEAVEGTSLSRGAREEAPKARGAQGVAGCDRRGAGPRGRHWPRGGRPAARLRPGPNGHRHAAGSARCARGRRPGRGGHRRSTPPAAARIPFSELRNLPRALAFALRRVEGGGAQEDGPPRPAVSAERCPRTASPAPRASPAASPFLPLAPATRGDRGRGRAGSPRRGARGPTWHVAAAARAAAPPKA